ncbi:hypothetical protein [Streptomyces sp. NPDC048639]|uniref:hypothetical protein n=1 Tax=Streptomyces sp. NPDC048639 TaxID=3365581 RepID=UPI003711B12B
MAEREQYRVDLSELDGVVSRLKSLDKDMDEPCSKVGYGTSISKTALGVNFGEAEELASAHDEMQTYMTETLKKLQQFIQDFGKKTQSVHGAYDDAEHDTQKSMGG